MFDLVYPAHLHVDRGRENRPLSLNTLIKFSSADFSFLPFFLLVAAVIHDLGVSCSSSSIFRFNQTSSVALLLCYQYFGALIYIFRLIASFLTNVCCIFILKGFDRTKVSVVALDCVFIIPNGTWWAYLSHHRFGMRGRFINSIIYLN